MSRDHHDYGNDNMICPGHNNKEDWAKLGAIGIVMALMIIIAVVPHI